jgi:hypothetical protein
LPGSPANHGGVLGIRLVSATPTHVLSNGDGRCERPFLAGDAQFGRGDRADLSHQLGIACGAQSDVMREQGRADDVVMAVNGIDTPEDRDRVFAIARVHRRFVVIVGGREPYFRRREIVAAGGGIAAVQDRTEAILTDILGGDTADVRLNDLADLFFHAQRAEQFVQSRLDRRVVQCRQGNLRPDFRMHIRGRDIATRGGRARRLLALGAAREHRGHQQSPYNSAAKCCARRCLDHLFAPVSNRWVYVAEQNPTAVTTLSIWFVATVAG